MKNSFKSLWNTWQWGCGRTIMSAVAAHVNSISVGMCQGFSAVLLPQLLDSNSSIFVDSAEASWIASLGVISNPLGALMSGFFMQILGRKTTVQLTAIPFLIGWTMIGLSTDLTNLCLGRFVSGVAVGMSSACYVYVAEVSLAKHRGVLSAFGPICVSIGVLIVYSLGSVMPWQVVSMLCALTSFLSFLSVNLTPESPSWLASKGRITDAGKSLMWLRRRPSLADKELAEILNTLGTGPETGFAPELKDFTAPTVWKPFLILLCFFILQVSSGIYMILYYAVNFFQVAGSTLDNNVASIIVALLRLIMSITGSIFIQHLNRRTMAMTSAILMCVSMAACGTYEFAYGALNVADRPYSWVPLVCILFNVSVSMLGMVPLPWMMMGELFPLKVRGIMGGVVPSLGYFFIFVTVKICPCLMQMLKINQIMWLFSGAAGLAACFIAAFLPETRGKTLLQIEEMFSTGARGEKTKCEYPDKGFKRKTITESPVYTISSKLDVCHKL
ncbi:Sugar/inositol transporter,Major facilitator superfamily domain,Major facilitator, sugar transporter- [Cinara cedri]|uniref:Sugar/inositol transporter,Major facilitator superfamily domain,Major facilitator, sugar transporter n=1 Tax=Cinara cedri TaxID=506608 RepID=A0A5E4MZD3_9HEMI|nr:Sugar/inositol transporter,Major facilitator superfamily domain,Major facilitator, sugar transporter- [Cinara cedri]